VLLSKIKFRIIGLVLLPIAVTFASILETAKPVELETQPILQKAGNTTQLSAVSSDFSMQLPIDGVVIRFESDEKPTVLFRFFNNNGIWSDWQNGKVFHESNTNRWLASNISQIATESIQFEFQINVNNSDIRIIEQGIFPVDKEIKSESTVRPRIFPTEIPKPTIITRQDWGARPPKRTTPIYNYEYLTIHHAAGWAASNLTEGKQAVKEIQDFHMDGRGWDDIAYHFLVDDAGNIYQGRPETLRGAHTLNWNDYNIGLCVLGCFDPPYEASAGIPCHQHLTQKAHDAIVHLFAWLIETYNYPNADLLKGHRDYYDYAHTSCPGQNIHQLLPELRNEINEFVNFGGPPFEYSLIDNYPNPFNSTTNIEYGIPIDCNVTIKIYNMIGEEITTLIDNESRIKGIHALKWSGKNNRDEIVPTGIYYYQIQTEQKTSSEVDKNFTETGKMLFLK